MPLTLPPAQNAVPAPVISSAPTSGFSPQVLIMLRSAGVKLSDIAVRASGRVSVMMATRSRITHSNSSVPVSMVVSVPMFPPLVVFPRHCGFRRVGKGALAPCPPILARLPMVGTLRLAHPTQQYLKLLDPRPQFQLPGPGAARLLQHVPVARGNGVGVEHRVRPVGGFSARRTADAAVDDEMRDMNALRRQFARHALGQSTQRELAHRKRRRLGIALDAGRRPG